MISVHETYNTVLTLLNKEQRGYLPPDEFNQIAQQSQIEIYEGYFHDLDLHLELARNDSDFGNIIKNIEEKILFFEKSSTIVGTNGFYTFPETDDVAPFYRLGVVNLNNVIVDEVSHREISYILLSPLTSPTITQPVYVRDNQANDDGTTRGIRVYPTPSATDRLVMTYVRRPAEPNWVGTIMDGQLVPNRMDSSYQDFELHASEAPELVMKILTYAGIAVKAADVIQFAQTREAGFDQEEKQ